MKYSFNGNNYDAILDGDDLILQSLTEDVIFPHGANDIREEAEKCFYSVAHAGQRLSSFIGEFIEDRIQIYIDSNKAEVITHDLN